jgi:hypothetical protein
LVSTQAWPVPVQSVIPVSEQGSTQTLRLQTSGDAHAYPQIPQFMGSAVVMAQ